MRTVDALTREQGRLLKPGRNCWRIVAAEQAALLVDGKAYYRAFRQAVAKAQNSVFILGWDVNSKVALTRGEAAGDLPVTLSQFLFTVLDRRPELQIYVLVWDFAMIYAFEREWAPIYNGTWRQHARLHFHMDGRHPLGASHHQKIVVVDDTLAFSGGFDLTHWRWDTPGHYAHDPLRVDPEGDAYPPFHDMQLMVNGEAAIALGELARARWKRATGRDARPRALSEAQLWPDDVDPDLTHVEVGIARTFPATNGGPAVREVEQLHLDMIAAAQQYIYIENQYLTSAVVGDRLAQSLRQVRGPSIVIVLPLKTGGWLEQHTMDVLRARLLRKLRAADRFGRLRVYCSAVPGLRGDCVMIHGKLMVVDDDYLRVGSANLSNRSMGLDSECDLAVESRGERRVQEQIAAVRNRVLSEHLGIETSQFQKTQSDNSNLVDTIDGLTGGTRTLRPLTGEVSEELDRAVPMAAVADPERPVDPEDMLERLIGTEHREPVVRRVVILTGILLLFSAMAAAWRWTPLGEWVDPERIANMAAWLREYPLGLLAVVVGYIVGSVLMLPVTVLIVATALVFGPTLGFLYSMLGTLLAALVTYWIGYAVGRRPVRRLAGAQINQLSQRLAQRGILTIVTLRMVPVAPFTIVNLVVGASHIRLKDYFWGSVLGLAPGVLAMSAFVDRLVAAITDPDAGSLAMLASLVAVIGIGAVGVRRWLKRSSTNRPKGAS